MKRNIACFLLPTLFIIILPLLFAQQDQITPKPNPEVEALKNRISVLESKLQTVENIKKMELASKLAEAEAKLRNAEFGKFERELRDSNNKWLWGWAAFFLGILAVVGVALWFVVKSLIADRVEKSLNGFKEAVAQVNTVKNELRGLQKEHTAAVLENFMLFHSNSGYPYPENINVLPEMALLDVFTDGARRLVLRHKAAEILSRRKSIELVSPALRFLNSVVNSDIYGENDFETKDLLRDFVSFVGWIETPEAYEGLRGFLHRLLTKNPKNKDLLLTDTIVSLLSVSIKLNMRDSVLILKIAISHLDIRQLEQEDLQNFARYFDVCNEPSGIKEILMQHGTNLRPDTETKCLEFLQKHDPDFVEQWQAEKESANTQNEESE